MISSISLTFPDMLLHSPSDLSMLKETGKWPEQSGGSIQYDNRRKDKARTTQRRQAGQFKYVIGPVEFGVELEIANSEYACIVAELSGGVR